MQFPSTQRARERLNSVSACKPSTLNSQVSCFRPFGHLLNVFIAFFVLTKTL